MNLLVENVVLNRFMCHMAYINLKFYRMGFLSRSHTYDLYSLFNFMLLCTYCKWTLRLIFFNFSNDSRVSETCRYTNKNYEMTLLLQFSSEVRKLFVVPTMHPTKNVLGGCPGSQDAWGTPSMIQVILKSFPHLSRPKILNLAQNCCSRNFPKIVL